MLHEQEGRETYNTRPMLG